MTLAIEDYDKIKKDLGIEFEKIMEVFSDQFVILLMNETLKQLRKTTSSGGTDKDA